MTPGTIPTWRFVSGSHSIYAADRQCQALAAGLHFEEAGTVIGIRIPFAGRRFRSSLRDSDPSENGMQPCSTPSRFVRLGSRDNGEGLSLGVLFEIRFGEDIDRRVFCRQICGPSRLLRSFPFDADILADVLFGRPFRAFTSTGRFGDPGCFATPGSRMNLRFQRGDFEGVISKGPLNRSPKRGWGAQPFANHSATARTTSAASSTACSAADRL